MSGARFEIVRTDAEQSWHARIIASNGEPLWVTENYADRRGAENAIRVLGEEVTYGAFDAANIRDVDERLSDEPIPYTVVEPDAESTDEPDEVTP